jgi:hypothetical protein
LAPLFVRDGVKPGSTHGVIHHAENATRRIVIGKFDTMVILGSILIGSLARATRSRSS